MGGSHKNSRRFFSLTLLAIVSLLWGTSFVLIDVSATKYSAASIAFYRSAVATIVLGIIALSFYRNTSIKPTTWLRIAILSIVGQVIPFFLLGISGHLTTSSSSAIMMGVAPVVTIILAAFLHKEHWPLWRWLGVFLAGCGVLIAFSWSGENNFALTTNDNLGKLCAIMAALGYAAGAIIFRSIPSQIPPILIATYSLFISTVLLGLFFIFQSDSTQLIELNSEINISLAAIFVLGLMNTGIAYLTYYTLISISGAGFASLNNYLVPIIGAYAGAALLNENITWNLLSGLLLIIMGIFMTAFFQKES